MVVVSSYLIISELLSYEALNELFEKLLKCTRLLSESRYSQLNSAGDVVTCIILHT